MFNLIPISLLIMALGGVIYIVSDHLSEFSAKDGSASGGEDEEDEFSFGIKAKLAVWINQLPWDNVKAQSLSFTQKSLHRMRIFLLKTDNHLMKLIGKISKKDEAVSTDFWEDFSKDNQKISPEQISEPEPPPHQMGRASPLDGGEVKIDLAFKSNPETEKFFDIKSVKKVFPLRGIPQRGTKPHLTGDHPKGEKRQKK